MANFNLKGNVVVCHASQNVALLHIGNLIISQTLVQGLHNVLGIFFEWNV